MELGRMHLASTRLSHFMANPISLFYNGWNLYLRFYDQGLSLRNYA